ncbi:hypothetical protein Droror1_Dr00023122 [Drosera rotundifolia]
MEDEMQVAEKRRILVAVDEGEESMNALTWCINNIIMGNPRTSLAILHVRRPTLIYPVMDDTAYVLSSDVRNSLEKHEREVARVVIEKAKSLCCEFNVEVDARIEDGVPKEVICDAVEKLRADLLVLGSHGYSLIARTFLGSVSNYCVHNASCPVLVVKMPKSSSSAGSTRK